MTSAARARWATPVACVALALLTFFFKPGHTWLQQDSQIYVPILEHERDASVLRNDILVQRSHVAYTLYDEIAVALRGVTGLGFREVLAAEQIATRALGIWGLMMLAESLGLGWWQALIAAAICSLGARIVGPEVLTVEYEPTPRAFAVPLLVCAMGLAARGRWLGAGIAAGVAVLYHAPTALPVLAAGIFAIRRDRLAALWPVAAAFAILLVAAQGQGEHQRLFASLAPGQETLQRMRAAYVYVSMWPAGTVLRHVLIFAGRDGRVRAAAAAVVGGAAGDRSVDDAALVAAAGALEVGAGPAGAADAGAAVRNAGFAVDGGVRGTDGEGSMGGGGVAGSGGVAIGAGADGGVSEAAYGGTGAVVGVGSREYAEGLGVCVPGCGEESGTGDFSERGAKGGVRGLEGRGTGELLERVWRGLVVPMAADRGPRVAARGSGAVRRAGDWVCGAEEEVGGGGGV